MNYLKTILGQGLFYLLMFIGLLIAVCSIAALSYLEEKEDALPVVLRYDSLFRKVDVASNLLRGNMRNVDSIMRQTWGEYDSFTIAVITDANKLQAKDRARFKMVAERWENQLAKHLNYLNRQKGDLMYFYNDASRQYRDIVAASFAQFRNESENLPGASLSVYGKRVFNYIISLSHERDISNNYNRFLENNSRFFLALKLARTNLYSFARELEAGNDSTQITSTLELPAESQYAVIKSAMPRISEPEVPSPAEDWGYLALGISWIVGPRNIQLLMLIGMLGFALFGATVSIFITRLHNNEVSISASVALILIRGFSAAIVVFLTMRAGIAILNSGESNPSPMLLFLFCFIGAVFSEQIWLWAKEKVSKSYPSALQQLQPNHANPLTDPAPPLINAQLDKASN